MSASQGKLGLCVLQWSLGIVILIEAVLFVLPGAAHSFARTHMPNVVRMILGFGEIVGSVLLLIPQTTIRGAWLLLAVFVMGILIHLLHGIYGIGNLVVYAAAAFAVAVGKS
jgi:type II secretory pathway component PulF